MSGAGITLDTSGDFSGCGLCEDNPPYGGNPLRVRVLPSSLFLEEQVPLYDVVCCGCGAVEEVLIKSHSSSLPESCSTCGKLDTLSREIGSSSFQLKGSGWAKDLYGSAPPTQTRADSKPA